ncbi:TPA: hypothetical protein DD449_02625 [Candidatus Berkelbacteria bacterium]|nr:hypothetical protein [Candidatus Berkelbacteria bacterium]
MNDLVIFQKAYDCHLYMYGALKNFPKSEKFTLAADIIAKFIRTMQTL